MLREEDIRIDIGRAVHGVFIRVTHLPSGISRDHCGPLRGVNLYELQQRWLAEIEAELRQSEMTQHIVPDYRTKRTRQKRC